MIERVLLVAWKGSPASSWLPALRSGGFTVLLEERTGARAWRTAKERGIDCVIIDGLKMVSHGRQTGSALRDTAKTRDIPIIWTNLHEDDAAIVQAEVKPDVLLPVPTDADSALAALMALAAEREAAALSRSAAPATEPLPARAAKTGAAGPTATVAVGSEAKSGSAVPRQPVDKPAPKRPATGAKGRAARAPKSAAPGAARSGGTGRGRAGPTSPARGRTPRPPRKAR